MNQTAHQTYQVLPASQLLTVQQIERLEEKTSIPGFKGVLRELEARKGKTSRKHFYIGFMTDHTGRIRVTFFRDDMEDLQGHLLQITLNHQGKGIRKDIYRKTTEMTVFNTAEIITLNPDTEDVAQQVNKAVQTQAAKYRDPKHPENPSLTIGMSGNCSSRIISAVISHPDMRDPIQWLYSENLPQLVDHLMTVYIDAIRKQEAAQNRS